MSRIAIVNADNICTRVVLAELGSIPGGIDVTGLPVGPRWRYDPQAGTWSAPAALPFDRSAMLSPAQLLRRFTLDERQAIRAAAANRPIIADWLDLVRMQPLWSLDDEYIVWGVTGAVQAGLLTQARGKEILGIED